MKAVAYDRYGGPDVLRVVDLPEPEPGPGEVLVEVRATSVNLSDWETLTGSPGYARIAGLRRPRRPVLGSDVAGVVAAVGPGVADLAPGDEVFGDNLQLKGGFAELCVVPAHALARKPAGLSFVDASTIPQSGAIALKGTARVTAGSRVCVNGAGGGSGAFALQLLRAAGAHVTAVDTAAKLDAMRELGADVALDFRRTTGPATARSTTSSTSSRCGRCSPTAAPSRPAGGTGASAARPAASFACSPSGASPARRPGARSGCSWCRRARSTSRR